MSRPRSLWERSLYRLGPREPHWWEQLLSPQESVDSTYEFRHHWFALVKPGLYGVVAVLSCLAALLLLPVGQWYAPVIYVLLALALGLARVTQRLWARSATSAAAATPPPAPVTLTVPARDPAPAPEEHHLVRTLPREPSWTEIRVPHGPRPDPMMLMMALLCGVAAAGLATAAIGLWMSQHASWVLAAVGLLAGCWSSYTWLGVSRDRLYVTTHRVIKLNRLFSQTVAVMPITRLVDLTVHEPWLGRLLGFGHFTFESAAQRQGLASFRTVPDVLELSLLIQRRALGMTADPDGTGPGSGSGSEAGRPTPTPRTHR